MGVVRCLLFDVYSSRGCPVIIAYPASLAGDVCWLAIFAKIEIMEAAIIVVLVVVFAILVVMMIIALGSRRKDSKTISFESKTTDEPKQLTQQEKSRNYQAQGGFNFYLPE